MFKFSQQIICLTLVALLLMQVFSKTIILVQYTVNKEYITNVFCVNKNKPMMHCNGKCHLKKEFNKTDKKEQSPINPFNVKTKFKLFYENNMDLAFLNPVILKTNSLISDYSSNLSDQHSASIFHPPQV